MHEAFIDLDELVIRCSDKSSKKFIQEAIACYRAGAFRSCIVSTWNAVVFDFLHKLRELELSNDVEATNLLRKFEKLSSEKNFKELWKFESDIPELALTKFELISQVEKPDIERLFDDRSRCAHPSMISIEEPFEATAELARYHLRSAVMHLLQRPPVQGRSARDRIFQSIKSENFPEDSDLAVQYFSKSPLVRARLSLIKDIILGLSVSLLTEDLPNDERCRQFSAVNAIGKMYSNQARDILNEKLSTIIEDKVSDEHWGKAIIYLGTVKFWDILSEPVQLKAKAFLEKLDLYDGSSKFYKHLSSESSYVLRAASYLDFLAISVLKKLELSIGELISLRDSCKDEMLGEIIKPLLEERLSEASLNDLVSMRVDTGSVSNDKLEPYLARKLREASFKTLFSLRVKQHEESLITLIDQGLREKVGEAPLSELLEIREHFSDPDSLLDEEDEKREMGEFLELIDECIPERVKECQFEMLLALRSKYNNEFFRNTIKPILKDNVSKIVEKFMLSSTFKSARDNSYLISEVFEFLDPIQWKYILEAFCKNPQIYGVDYSGYAPDVFCRLFKRSLDFDGIVPSYWLSFREALDEPKFNSLPIDKLKHLIDSHK